jgi:hypothetical protein
MADDAKSKVKKLHNSDEKLHNSDKSPQNEKRKQRDVSIHDEAVQAIWGSAWQGTKQQDLERRMVEALDKRNSEPDGGGKSEAKVLKLAR